MENSIIKKKIGIVTYHRPINYGAILQAYALQKKIKECGVECDIIDYRNQTLEKRHKKKKLIEAKSFKQFIRDVVLLKNYNLKYVKFRKFTEMNLTLSRPFNDFKELSGIEDLYDKFVVGSDQVWNYKINKMDHVYLLSFVKEKLKKASYAASFGVDNIPECYRDKYIQSLKDFDKISVREKQGSQIIRDLISKECDVVLDPTLLLSKEEWHEVAEDNIDNDDKYILVYAYGDSKNIMELAKNISKKTSYKIIRILSTYKKSLKIKYIKSAGPGEFLGLFKNAEYVITNSFHGTAFSINFNKQFYVELLPEREGTNSRIIDLLNLFHLQDRIITSISRVDLNQTIDYRNVNKLLNVEREKSYEFLRKICSPKNI